MQGRELPMRIGSLEAGRRSAERAVLWRRLELRPARGGLVIRSIQLSAAALLIGASTAHAETHVVDPSAGPLFDITSALAATSPGDSVEVPAGTFDECDLLVPDGVTLSYDDGGLVANNTIADNSRYGLYAFTCCSYSGTTGPTTAVINNLITGSGTYGLIVSGYNSFSAWESNDVYGSGSSDYQGYSDATGSDGNLSVDPLYVGDPDWSLQSKSPVIDQGTDLSSYGFSDDYDGIARPAGSRWDMGAYEH